MQSMKLRLKNSCGDEGKHPKAEPESMEFWKGKSVSISPDCATESEVDMEYNDSNESESLKERWQSHCCILWVPSEDGEVHLEEY